MFWSITAVALTSGAANCLGMYFVLHMAYVESLVFPTLDQFLETMLSTHEKWVWYALCLTYAKYAVCSYREWSMRQLIHNTVKALKKILENTSMSEEDVQCFKQQHIVKLHQKKHDERFFFEHDESVFKNPASFRRYGHVPVLVHGVDEFGAGACATEHLVPRHNSFAHLDLCVFCGFATPRARVSSLPLLRRDRISQYRFS